MNIVVQKYGGSSLATPDKIRKVAARIAATAQAGRHVVCIVSATGKTTDELVSRSRDLCENPAPRELDLLMAGGEQISSALVAMALQQLGHDAVALSGPQAGYITCTNHTNARIVEMRPFRVLEALDHGRIVIVAGFQGRTPDGELTTLGRGGSDTAAVAMAAALGAESCEICTDVDGVYQVDPRLINDARRLQSLGAGEMLALAKMGAQVLHPASVQLAIEKDVRLWVRSTFGSEPGTLVAGDIDGRRFAGITQHLPVLHLTKDPLVMTNQTLKRELERLPMLHTTLNNGRCHLFLNTQNLSDEHAFARELSQQFPVETELALGLVAVVGENIGEQLQPFWAVNRQLGAAGFDVRHAFAQRESLTFYLPRPQVPGALQHLNQLLQQDPLVSDLSTDHLTPATPAACF